MSTPAERIRDLVRAGTISPEEGARLLAAVEPARAPIRAALLWNPFERFGGGPAVGVGVIAAVISLGASRLGIRFDGAFDTHHGRGPAPWSSALADQLVAWLLPAVGFWAVARLFGRDSRFLDHLGMVSLVRAAVVLFALVGHPFARIAGDDVRSPAFAVLIVLSLAFLVWLAVLLFFGFRTVSGLRGPRLGFGLALAVVGVEVISKVVLHALGV